MSDISFSCPHCQTPLIVDEEGAGLEIPCPTCGQELTIPAQSEARPPSPTAEEPGESVIPGLSLSEDELDRLAQEILRRTAGQGTPDGARIIKRADGEHDIAFACHQCNTPLVVELAGAGLEIDCPSCQAQLTIPDPQADAEQFLASALAARMAAASASPTAAAEAAPPEPARKGKKGKGGQGKKDSPQSAPVITAEPAPPPLPALGADADPQERARIPLKPKFRTRKPAETAAPGQLPMILPGAAAGAQGGTLTPEQLAQLAAQTGGGYVLVPIQTPNGPVTMLAPASKTEETTRKRPRYPQKYSELAAKLRSADPGEETKGEALLELEKRGPLVSRVLAQHFIEKALEETGELEKEDEEDAGAAGTASGHRGALKSPRRVEIEAGAAASVPPGPAKVRAEVVPHELKEPRPLPPHHGHNQHRTGRDKPGSKVVALTAAAIAAGLVTLASLIYYLVVDASFTTATLRPGREKLPQPADVASGNAEGVFLSPIELNSARDTIARYASATTWEERLPLVRKPEEVGPLMQKHYTGRPLEDMNGGEIKLGLPFYRYGLLQIVAEVDAQDNLQVFPVSVVRTAGGQYLVDWQASTGHGELTWEELRQQKPTEEGAYRVTLSPTNYYNFEFAQESEYQSFKLDRWDRSFTGIYAYVPRNSDMMSEIESYIRPNNPMQCIVKLRYPEDPQTDHLVEITGFVRNGWVEP